MKDSELLLMKYVRLKYKCEVNSTSIIAYH